MNARSDWTKVPGWDPAKQEYVDLDCEQWIRENKIREAGKEDGEQEFPASDAVQPNEMYHKILDWVNGRGKACHAEVSRYLGQLRDALELESGEGMAPIQFTVQDLRGDGIVKLTDRAQVDRSDLLEMQREALDARAALAAFKERAKLERPAQYDDRETWYWWLVGIVVVEALANAMMLAGVHEYGLLGAIVIMLAVGVVNAGILGGLIGEGWRQKYSVELLPKVGGWLMVALGTTGMILWNLLVGHFRDSMLAVATRAASGASSLGELLADDTPQRFAANLFGLEAMLSWLLALIGAGCCIFAATKWLGRDDVYPGYGKVHRAEADLSKDYRDATTNRRANLKRIYEEYTERIWDQQRQVENKKGNHQRITDSARRVVREFPMHVDMYQKHLDHIIAAYRDANEKARASTSPEFFRSPYPIDQDMLQAPSWRGVRKPDYDEDWEGFQQARDDIRTAYEHARDGYPTLEDRVEEGNSQGAEK